MLKCQMAQWPTDAHSFSGVPRKNLKILPVMPSPHLSSSAVVIGCHAVSSSSLQDGAKCCSTLRNHAASGTAFCMCQNCCIAPNDPSTRLSLHWFAKAGGRASDIQGNDEPDECLAHGGASLVSVGMVVVVLDPPRLKRIDERRERQRAHDVLQQLVLAEAAVPAVVAHDKPLHRAQRS